MDQTILPVRSDSDIPDTESIITSFEYDGADDFVSDMEEANKATSVALDEKNAFNNKSSGSGTNSSEPQKMVAVEFDMSKSI